MIFESSLIMENPKIDFNAFLSLKRVCFEIEIDGVKLDLEISLYDIGNSS